MYVILEYNDEPRIPFIKVHRSTQSLERAHEEVKELWKQLENGCQQSVLSYELTDEKDYDLIECNSVSNESTVIYKSTAYLLSIKKDVILSYKEWRSAFPECFLPVMSNSENGITTEYIIDCYQKGLLSMDDLFSAATSIYGRPLCIRPSHRVVAIIECESMDQA